MSIILMFDSLLAGIYGMNFENMPELKWYYGYFGLLAFMAVVSILLLLYFRRLKWF
jgi:magnesium transporter